MSGERSDTQQAGDARRDRLKAALRENLKRRKAQERARDGKAEPARKKAD